MPNMITSLVRDGFQLKPIEIEISVTPGLPKFQIVGLPDGAIKESVSRIRSAIKAQGFHIPLAQQILINLKPAYTPKSSAGLDLAVAIAYLLKTQQLEVPEDLKSKKLLIYGELGLEGQAFAPQDLDSFVDAEDWSFVTGPQLNDISFSHWRIGELKDFSTPRAVIASQKSSSVRPAPEYEAHISVEMAGFALLAATGEHSCFVAGPAGSGKTTFARLLWTILPTIHDREYLELRALNRRFSRPEDERPIVAPHHTTSSQGLLGGGMDLYPGEICKAHRGLLLLDEFLEFAGPVKEALREPIETGVMQIRKGARTRTYPAEFMLVATSNLCPCGSYTPDRPVNCRFGLHKCRSTLQRLSGPLLDRFELCGFSHKWLGPRTTPLADLVEKIDAAVELRKSRNQRRPNHFLTLNELEDQARRDGLIEFLPADLSSRRRTRSLLAVARTVADLAGRQHVEPRDLQTSMEYSWLPFVQIERMG
jgi:magnesium chelatase family protein